MTLLLYQRQVELVVEGPPRELVGAGIDYNPGRTATLLLYHRQVELVVGGVPRELVGALLGLEERGGAGRDDLPVAALGDGGILPRVVLRVVEADRGRVTAAAAHCLALRSLFHGAGADSGAPLFRVLLLVMRRRPALVVVVGASAHREAARLVQGTRVAHPSHATRGTGGLRLRGSTQVQRVCLACGRRHLLRCR